METRFTNQDIEGALKKKEKYAGELLKDKEKSLEVLKAAEKLLEKIKNVPVIGGFIGDIVDTIDLIRCYMNKTYTDVPVRIIISAFAAILYVLSPIDLIPDTIPILGYMDDAAVVLFVLNRGLSGELKKFNKWKNMELKKEYLNFLGNEIQSAIGANHLVATLLTSEKTLKLLMVEKFNKIEFPLEVHPIIIDIDYKNVVKISEYLDESIQEILAEQIRHMCFSISEERNFTVLNEYEFDEFDDWFEIIFDEMENE